MSDAYHGAVLKKRKLHEISHTSDVYDDDNHQARLPEVIQRHARTTIGVNGDGNANAVTANGCLDRDHIGPDCSDNIIDFADLPVTETYGSDDENDEGADTDLDSLFDEPIHDLSSRSSSSAPSDAHLLEWGLRSNQSSISKPETSASSISAAKRTAPPIPGLYFDPQLLLPADLADTLYTQCMRTFFPDTDCAGGVNQVMLFERAGSDGSRLPAFLQDLLHTLADLLRDALPPTAHALLFPAPGGAPRARQAILNLYHPGEGITPHVDLLRRFGDGIVGVSLRGACVMRFAPARADGGDSGDVGGEAAHDVFLPPRSVLVLSGAARYAWTHGIARAAEDVVLTPDGARAERILRGVRLSITFRWLLPGADVVGELE